MAASTRPRLRLVASGVAVLAAASILSACAGPTASTGGKKRSKEYFAETEYGVKASPRVSWLKTRLPRGGGRDQLGKPYMVRGKMYYPKEDKNYRRVGYASWYGDAFHGRLTANGEIYDMTHLTAAHPTMPLPSYARVTNTENGSSVIVRVNDRGPYASDRVIDLSRKAAEMLDYTRHGTAKVKVEYVGRAPLDGTDDSYLLASYKPGKTMLDPSDGLPTGVMVAMNGGTPSARAKPAAPFAFASVKVRQPVADIVPLSVAEMQTATAFDMTLPDFGPTVPERPDDTFTMPTQVAMATMSYAETGLSKASEAFAALTREAPATGADGLSGGYVAAGVFADRDDAVRVAGLLHGFGRVQIDTMPIESGTGFAVSAYEDGRFGVDDLLQAAWANGAPDALVVRD